MRSSWPNSSWIIKKDKNWNWCLGNWTKRDEVNRRAEVESYWRKSKVVIIEQIEILGAIDGTDSLEKGWTEDGQK